MTSLQCRYAEHGFIVNNDNVQGSIMCVGTLCVAWDVARLEDVTLDSLALLDVVRPPPGAHLRPTMHVTMPGLTYVSAAHLPCASAELLVLGCGRTTQRLPDELVRGLAAKGISVDVSDMPNAIATFNILSQEGRAVAAAMLPLAA
jgi:NADH dehydrogenase [ubiquinone] 1 alpha subcomplex assembly factor 3